MTLNHNTKTILAAEIQPGQIYVEREQIGDRTLTRLSMVDKVSFYEYASAIEREDHVDVYIFSHDKYYSHQASDEIEILA